MTPMATILIFSLLSLSNISKAQDRAPHGLSNESPIAFSPSAFEFFHPKTEHPSGKDLCAGSSCSPLPMAATVASSLGHESRSRTNTGGSKVGAGAIIGIVFGFGFVVVLAMGIFYVVTRRANLSRSNSAKPDA